MSPIYLRSPCPFPLVYGIISRCPMYRIRVASDSADNQLAFSCFSNWSDRDQKFTSWLRSSQKWPLMRDWTRYQLFIRVSPPRSCYSRWKCRCFLTIIITMNLSGDGKFSTVLFSSLYWLSFLVLQHDPFKFSKSKNLRRQTKSWIYSLRWRQHL